MHDGDADIPPGWSYNPASWSQRWPIVALALVGFAIAGYLSLYQFKDHYGWGIARVWEPFFGDGTRRTLTSDLSYLLPVPDAALGAFAYLLDAVTGLIGGPRRWKTMPWIVIVFALLVGPLGVVSVALVIAQPLWVGAWCTLCLASAAVSALMIGPAMDEALAACQHLKRVRDAERGAFWPAFWGVRRGVNVKGAPA